MNANIAPNSGFSEQIYEKAINRGRRPERFIVTSSRQEDVDALRGRLSQKIRSVAVEGADIPRVDFVVDLVNGYKNLLEQELVDANNSVISDQVKGTRSVLIGLDNNDKGYLNGLLTAYDKNLEKVQQEYGDESAVAEDRNIVAVIGDLLTKES